MLGSALARAMRRRGIGVRVWNRTFERAQLLEDEGAQAFADPAEAARGAERLHLCLRDDDSVDAVLDAALPGIAPGTPVVDHTTVLPQRVPERAERLRAAGFPFIHAPMFIGPPMALASTGTILASGDRTTFERVRPALAAMCTEVRDLGERVDAAAIYKLMGNAMILAVVGGIADALRIGEERGLTREQAYELYDFFDPTGQIKGRGRRMVSQDYDAAWTLDMALKDAVLMQGAANHERLPVVDAVAAAMRDAVARGLGDRDLAAVAARVPAG